MSLAVETHDLGKKYRDTWALRACTLQIPEGRIVALIGPNGAGKSTLLNMLVGLVPPTVGRVRIFGASPHTEPEATLPKIGFLHQDRPLYRSLTVAEHLHLGAALNPGWDDDLALARLKQLGIPLDKKVGKLSGGQQGQIALVLALAKRPQLRLLDEPVAALDPLARREFLQVLMDAAVSEGMTVLFSSHLVGELERVCDYLVLINNGRVRFAGDLDAFVENHRLLVGPRLGQEEIARIGNVIAATHTERQTSLLVKANGNQIAGEWDVRAPGFEEIVLGYLAQRDRESVSREAA